MVSIPADTPVRTPVPDPMVATAVALLLQAPPAGASLKVSVDPAHTDVAPPAIEPGIPVTVTSTVVFEPETV